MLTTKATFDRKVKDFEPKNCVIEKVITLKPQDYDAFSKNLLSDYDFIKDNKDLQYFGEDATCHCILVVGEERSDGVLVQGEGYDYCRYSAFLPNAAAFLAAAMEQGQSAEQKTVVSGLNLKDLVSASLEDIHLIHSDEEIDLATICELNSNTLTDVGKEEWADVLNTEVHRIFHGTYGLQIEVSGVKPQRLSDFSYMLAGYCSVQDYEKWVTQKPEVTLDETNSEPQPEDQKMVTTQALTFQKKSGQKHHHLL